MARYCGSCVQYLGPSALSRGPAVALVLTADLLGGVTRCCPCVDYPGGVVAGRLLALLRSALAGAVFRVRPPLP